MPGVLVSPFPYCQQCHVQKATKQTTCCNYALEEFETLLKQQASPSDTAGSISQYFLSDFKAVLVEPILGEGGYVVPPPGWFYFPHHLFLTDFLARIKEICKKNGILMIADEVQTGVAR